MHNNGCVVKFCPNPYSNTWHKTNIASKFDYLNIYIPTQYFNIRHHTDFACATPLQTNYTEIQNIWCCVNSHALILEENIEEKYLWSTRCKYILHSFLVKQLCILLSEKWSIEMRKLQKTWMTSGFCCRVNEIFALLWCYTAGINCYLPTFRDNLSVQSSRIKKSKALVDPIFKG